jgi:hypothetical protein
MENVPPKVSDERLLKLIEAALADGQACPVQQNFYMAAAPRYPKGAVCFWGAVALALPAVRPQTPAFTTLDEERTATLCGRDLAFKDGALQGWDDWTDGGGAEAALAQHRRDWEDADKPGPGPSFEAGYRLGWRAAEKFRPRSEGEVRLERRLAEDPDYDDADADDA